MLHIVLCLSLSSGIKIRCNFEVSVWSRGGAEYSCWDVKITDLNNPSVLTDVAGSHKAGKTNVDVRGFFMNTDNNLERLPKDIEKFFPNLLFFGWQRGSLKNITADDLKPFPNLSLLSFSHNQLESLESDLFKHTKALKWIWFTSNFIEHVGSRCLHGLNGLEFAEFSNNKCISFGATSKVDVELLRESLQTKCLAEVIPQASMLSSVVIPSPQCTESCLTCNDVLVKKIEELENERNRYRNIFSNILQLVTKFEN